LAAILPKFSQKALRSLETGLSGLDEIEIDGLGKGDDLNVLPARSARPHQIACLSSAKRCAWV